MWMRLVFVCSVIFTGISPPVLADSSFQVSGSDSHVTRWNRFVDVLYDLHNTAQAKYEIRQVSRIGGYPRHPEFYEEISYYDKKSGKLLSVIQWEREEEKGVIDKVFSMLKKEEPKAPRDRIHSISINIYDDQGRVIRDYSATYLPTHRNAPSQTLIFLHQYNGDLHAFRGFDATGNRLFEKCEGRLESKGVDLSLDDIEIAYAVDEKDGVMQAKEYRACFDGLAVTADVYLSPR
ncbi:MAG: hypothetical protein GXP09_07090 [Gammaproteobacteria bacterium]|nr:hypothetical protein [Gammaproteobacteria bacterium]